MVLPALYEVHLQYSGITTISVSLEQVFSKYGQIINDPRNRLFYKNLDMIILLNKNLEMFNKV